MSFFLQILHFVIKNLRIVCFHRYRLISVSERGKKNFVLLRFGRISSTRRADGFRGLADDRLSRTLPARFRVPSASQVSAFTLRSRVEISRARAREKISLGSRSGRATCSRYHRTSSSNGSARDQHHVTFIPQ